jgi:tetratricopeptide (TPR) repeat protein
MVLFVVLRRMTGERWRSGMVALLFAVHPLHVESVAWIAERKDVLSALFWMLTLWAYAGYAARPGRARYALALFLFCLGLMAKPMLVTVPVALLLLDLWPLGRGLRILEKPPFFAASLASSMAAYIAHQKGGAVASFEIVPLAARVENALITYVVYVLQSFWPSHLAVFYPYSLQSLVVPAIFAGVALCAVTGRARVSAAPIPCRWMVLVCRDSRAGHRTDSDWRAIPRRPLHLHPQIGLSLAVVWETAERLKQWPRFRVALAAAVTAACMTLTWIQVQYWRDDISLYQHAVAVVPDNYVAYFNLASALDAQGKTDEAVVQLREAVRARPSYVPARAELGQLLARQEHPDEALSELQTAVRLRPDDSVAHFRLGSVLGTLGRIRDAAAEFSEAVRLQPQNADAHYNLGIALAQEDRVQEAAREFDATVRLRPDDVNARFNLGISLARLGKLDDAIVQFSEAVRLKPDFADAHRALEQAIRLRQSPAKQ